MSNVQVQEEFFSFPEIDKGHWHEVCEFVKRFGCYTSVALFDPRSEIFSISNVDGMIGYRSTSKCRAVFGDPVCSDAQMPDLIDAFHKSSANQKQRVVYTAVSQKFASWALKNGCCIAIEVAEELFLNPQDNILSGTKGRKLRIRINQAKKAHVTTREYIEYDLRLEKELEKVGNEWLEKRSGPQIFLAHVDLFTDRIGKRWFYATQADTIVGVVLLNQLSSGWVLNLSMITSEAPPGTSESMVLSVLDTLRKEGCESLSLGIVVKEELGTINGLGSFSKKLIQFLYKKIIQILQLDGRKRYWKKFYPKAIPHFIVCPRKKLGFSEIICLLKSLNTTL